VRVQTATRTQSVYRSGLVPDAGDGLPEGHCAKLLEARRAERKAFASRLLSSNPINTPDPAHALALLSTRRHWCAAAFPTPR
jgi:hypothetical protein